MVTLCFLPAPCYKNTSHPCRLLSCKAPFALSGRAAGAGRFCGEKREGGRASYTRSRLCLCIRMTVPVWGTEQPGGTRIQPNCHKNSGHPTISNQCPRQKQSPLQFSPGQEEFRKKLLPLWKGQGWELLVGSGALHPGEQLSLSLKFIATLFYS